MIENKNIVCTCCPMGCRMTVTVENGEVTGVKGNTCKRGAAFAVDECLNPKRTLTTTVKTVSGGMLPVKTESAIPKPLLFDAMKVLATLCVKTPIKIGDVVCADICGSGVNVVAAGKQSK